MRTDHQTIGICTVRQTYSAEKRFAAYCEILPSSNKQDRGAEAYSGSDIVKSLLKLGGRKLVSPSSFRWVWIVEDYSLVVCVCYYDPVWDVQ